MPSSYRQRALGKAAPPAPQPRSEAPGAQAVVLAEEEDTQLESRPGANGGLGWAIGDASRCVICGSDQVSTVETIIQQMPKYLWHLGVFEEEAEVGRCARHRGAVLVPCLTCRCVNHWENSEGQSVCACCHPDAKGE